VTDGSRVVPAIAQALGIEALAETRALEALIERFKRQSILLILDNCEHVIAQAATVAETLVLQCSRVRILATSREALKVAGERVYRLPPLDSPAAVSLFVERAHSADQNFALTGENAPVITDICGRLDGIPLAIELAAARARALPLATLAQMLDQRFEVLSAGRRTALPRQRTMRALFDWSYDLLSLDEQRVFEQLSIFADGWTLEAAAALCGSSTTATDSVRDFLSSLLDKSLVVADAVDERARYHLSESTREYARENWRTAATPKR